jgi:hypothetical protein
MQARGGESIGKAFANVGQDLAAGVEKYQENKKITAEMLGNVEGVISAYPEVVTNAPASIAPLLKKLVDNGTVNQREAMTLHGYVAGQQKTIESKAKRDLMAAQTQTMLSPQPKDDRTAIQNDYDRAVAGGYRGSFIDYQNIFAEASRPVLTPEEEARLDEMSMRNKAAFAANEAIIEGGAAARASLRSIEQITSLLDDGLKTGFAGETLLRLKQLGKRLGMEGLETADAEQAQVLFGDFVMNRIQQTKGAISNKEMELFATFSPGLSKTPEGNRQILSFIKQADQRAQELSKKVRTWRANGDSETVIRAKIEDYQDENPLSIGTPTPVGADGKRDLGDGFTLN